MAGDWIKMRSDLHDDPAVFRLAGMLNMDRYAVVGRLHAFWSWADKHSVDGRVDGATTQLVDTVVSHIGFADALLVVLWLKHDDRGIEIPSYERHNGKTAKERSLKNQRQSRWRNGDGAVDGHVDATPSTREEKRREDITPISPSGFARFWLEYPGPRKISKAKCLQIWGKQKLEPIADQIIGHVAAMKRSSQWQEEGGRYIPAPVTYLNQSRWQDGEPEKPVRKVVI